MTNSKYPVGDEKKFIVAKKIAKQHNAKELLNNFKPIIKKIEEFFIIPK